MYAVYGIGNPLLDFVTQADFSLIERLGTRKGTMNLIDYEEMQKILDLVKTYKNIPGGSCANTIRGIAWLAACDPIQPSVYCGAVGNDSIGSRYLNIMKQSGVHTQLALKKSLSGCSVIMVTPDHERTMFTYLGACREFEKDDLDFDALARSRYLYITGYMWDTENQKEAVQKAVDFALEKDITVAFDLADPFVVQRYREEFLSWIPGRVNILFGNREELKLMMAEEKTDEELINSAGELSDLVIMKIGKQGCLVNESGLILKKNGFAIEAIDTTAAGDCFAAGFLFGRLKGYSNSVSARLANRLASCIASVEGCDFTLLEYQHVVEEGG